MNHKELNRHVTAGYWVLTGAMLMHIFLFRANLIQIIVATIVRFIFISLDIHWTIRHMGGLIDD